MLNALEREKGKRKKKKTGIHGTSSTVTVLRLYSTIKQYLGIFSGVLDFQSRHLSRALKTLCPMPLSLATRNLENFENLENFRSLARRH